MLVRSLAAGAAILFVDSNADALTSNNFNVDGVSPRLNDVGVDLRVAQNEASFATGSIGGRPAVFKGSPFGGMVKGSMLDTSFKAAVSQTDEVPQGSNYVTTTTISGTVGSAPTTLLGSFTIGPNFLFENGAITGRTANEAVQVTAQPNMDFDTSSAVTVVGHYGDTEFSLVAVLPDGQSGTIAGTVASKKVRFEISASNGNDQSVRLRGHYSGPIGLLALIVGAACYFGG